MVRAAHERCGAVTEVRLPAHLPATAVRHVACAACAEQFDATHVEDAGLAEPRMAAAVAAPSRERPAPVAAVPAVAGPGGLSGPRLPRVSLPRPSLPSLSLPAWRPTTPALPRWASDPGGRFWRLATIPVAAAAVIAALLVIQGDDPDTASTPFSDSAATAPAQPGPGRQRAADAGGGSLVRESSFTLALPSGWERSNPSGGATFFAVSDAGDADATLWVERDPSLAFTEFEARSLDQLRSLAGSAQVVERVAAPTADATVVRLAADAPPGSPAYEVTLRSAGPYRYYLSTTVQPDASRSATEGADLIHGSFLPVAAGAGGQGKGS